MLCCIWKEKRLNKGRKSSVSSPNRSLVLGLGWPQCHNQHERALPCRWRLRSAADEHLVSSGAVNQAGAVPNQCPDAFPLPSAYCGTSWGGWRLTLVTSSCALGRRQQGKELPWASSALLSQQAWKSHRAAGSFWSRPLREFRWVWRAQFRN